MGLGPIGDFKVNMEGTSGVNQKGALNLSEPHIPSKSPAMVSSNFETTDKNFADLQRNAPFLGKMPIGDQWVPSEVKLK